MKRYTRVLYSRGDKRIVFMHKPPSSELGRFGGGWQWAIGIMAGELSCERGTIIIRLLVADLSIRWGRRT